MPLTEQDLRESLRRATEAPPHVADRVGAVERRVRRRRTRAVAVTAIAVIVALVAVPLARWLPDRLSRNEIANSDITPEQMDAMMKFATFVAWWEGRPELNRGEPDLDNGVLGVRVTSTLPPFVCAVASPAAGAPAGTQGGWVLGQGAVLGQGGQQGQQQGPVVTVATALWPVGVTSCGERASGQSLVDAPSSRFAASLAAPIIYAQTYADPSQPALDVESVYAAVPQELVTDLGRQVMSDYRSQLAKIDFGTPVAQTDRALTALAAWVSVGVANQSIHQPPPQTGPASLDSGVPAVTVDLPRGFSVRWTDTGTFCVDGAAAGSVTRRIQSEYYGDPGTPPQIEDGRCP